MYLVLTRSRVCCVLRPLQNIAQSNDSAMDLFEYTLNIIHYIHIIYCMEESRHCFGNCTETIAVEGRITSRTSNVRG